MPIKTNLSELIRTRREALGLSQEELGKRCGVSRQTVAQWENGKSSPKRSRSGAVAKALQIPLSAIDPLASSTALEDSDGLLRHGAVPGDNSRDGESGAHHIPLITLDQFDMPVDALAFAKRLRVDALVPRDARAFVLEDDAMLDPDNVHGSYGAGDIVIAAESVQPVDGDDVVANVDGVFLFRRYRPRGKAIDLVPLSPNFATVTINEARPGLILATLVEHRRKRRHR